MNTAGLVALDGFDFAVYASPGSEERARAVAYRARRARAWLTDILGREPTPPLFVVGPEDWSRVASIPLYGMPHAIDGKVVVGTVPAPFWQEIIDWFTPHLETETRDRLLSVYGDGFASLFPDLLVVHELTHLYHVTDDATEPDFPRVWLAELFANLGLYGYVAEFEPEQLPILETICSAAREVPAHSTPVRALDDMLRSFEFENGPTLYCWFEFMLINGAKRIWEAAGPDGLRMFHKALRDAELSDDEIEARLTDVHPDAGRVMSEWPCHLTGH